ncbi:MAG TPA: VOC family protein [Candidatus Saccharimonadales bacterium]|nr:VOC family protein [Candidatus Saccharimonadales bacterium]
MQKIVTCLWFNKDAEAAMNFYADVFNGSPAKRQESKIVSIARFPNTPMEGPAAGLEGKVAQGIVELEGQQVMLFDGGPTFVFNEAASLVVSCETQEEVDYLWEKLSAVPESEACGWLKDSFGVSWQIVPKALGELMSDPDSEQSGRVMQAMMQMKKLDIAGLKQAAESKE